MDKYEDFENTLDPHRAEERAAAAAEVATRLRDRGVAVTGGAAVEAHGGDLMMDDLKSSQPDDPHFVLPRRTRGEAIRAYIGRIDEATERLRRHPRQRD